jgi:hypothetical protein
MGVPADLRTVLEQCLSEEASTENLEIYLPTVRQIITSLLQGLRGKQSIYRRMVSDHRHKSSSERGTPATSTHDRTESRSSRSSRRERAGESTTSLHRSQLSRTIDNDKDVVYARRSTGRRDPGLSTSTSTTNSDDPLPPPHPPPTGGLPPPPVQQNPATPDRNGIHHERASDTPRQRPTPAPLESTTRSDYFGAVDDHSAAKGSPPPPPLHSPPPVPASVKRYSLVDKPAPSPVVVIDEPTSPATDPNGPATPPPDVPTTLEVMQTPGVANSLAALKKSDTLERRASKRFSTYNISKMTGGSARDRLARGANSNRRSLAVSSALTPGELAVLTEVDEPEATGLRRDGSSRSRKTASRPVTPDVSSTPPVPPLPSTPSRTPEPTPNVAIVESSSSTAQVAVGDALPASPSSRSFVVFLQLGREVKKAVIEPGLSFSSLRVLFVDKFSYNPGMDNFPAIYIRDPSSGVQYELEDMDEVKEKCLLSLNIERAYHLFSCVFASLIIRNCSTRSNQATHRCTDFDIVAGYQGSTNDFRS